MKMSTEYTKYFKSIEDYFWQWEDNGEVVAIPNSGTIAYRETIQKILTVLAPNGFPLFGTLLLALAYTSVSKFEMHKSIEDILVKSKVRKNGNIDLRDALQFLHILKSLGPEYHTGEKKLLLLVTIFKGSHNRISIKKSKQILSSFKSKKPLNLSSQELTKAFNQVYLDTRPLQILLKKYPTINSIKNAMAGIDLTEFEDIDLEEIETFDDSNDDLISQVIRNKETYKSGALIKRIWSSANIPMHNKVPSGQPFGGVADITNKGEFDKLLISEFANEDVAFLSRLANREAMYFNREAPPSENKEDRIIILDVSLKNWGTPKIIAFALMLGIAHHPKTVNNYVCYAVGRRAYKLTIDDIDGIVESAQVLDTSLSAAAGLNELFSENDFSSNEVFFISERSSSDIIEVSQVLTDHNYPIDYWMYPDAQGEVAIFKKYRSGKKHHQSFKLPLSDLWKQSSKKGNQNHKIKTGSTSTKIHMLVPTPKNIEQFIFSGDELFIMTKDGQLLRKEYAKDGRSNKGWQVLHNQIPYLNNYYFSIGRNGKGQYVLLSCHKKQNILFLYNIELNTSIDTVFSEHHNTRFKNFVYEDFSFYLIGHIFYHKINIDGSVEKKEDKGSLVRKMVYADVVKEKGVKKLIGEVEQSIKRINTISIKGGHLIINNHKLFLNGQGDLKLTERTAEFIIVGINSEKVTKEYFRFPNGSTVHILNCGVLVLESYNKIIPKVFFIPIIGKPLAAYIMGTFAGNESYFMEKKYLLRREKIFKLKGQKTDMIQPPISFIESDIEIRETENYHYTKVKEEKAFRKINMSEFYPKYVSRFISEIERNDS